jgi:rod shape-determining protein MreB
MRSSASLPATLRTNKQHLRNALKGIVDNLMIVPEPLAVAYGLDALVHTMIIDIGAGTTDFCLMKGRYSGDDDQRSLTAAGDSIDARLPEARPGPLSCRKLHDLHGARVEGAVQLRR